MNKNKKQDYTTISHRSDGSSVIERKEGETRENEYYILGKKAPHVYLEHKICDQYAAYILIEKDLRSVLSWLKIMDDTIASEELITRATHPEKMDLIKSLFISSITFYAKCFTTCEGRKIKLDSKDYVDDKYKNIHSTIMDLRNNLAAHSGKLGFEKARVALVLDPNINSEVKPELFIEIMQMNYIISDNEDEADLFRSLVLSVQNNVKEKIKVIYEKILDDVVRPKGKLYWYIESGKEKKPQKLG